MKTTLVFALQNPHRMRVFLILIILCAIRPAPFLLERVAEFSEPLQASCSNLFSESFRHRELAQGFVCGVGLQDIESRTTFQRTGLIHLMVVSGGHLQLLSFLFFLLIPLAWQKRWWVLAALALLLFSYSLVTGFQPPVVRAFLSVCVLAVSRIFRWNWDLSKLQLSSGLLSLALFPQWIHSLSFFLSWLASMGFLLAPLCFRYRSRKQGPSWRQTLLTTGLIQAFVTVVFGNFSWLAVLMNALFAVPLAFVLLILSLAPLAVPDSVSHFAPGVIPFVDRLWDYLLQALQSVLIWAPPPADINFKEISWLKLWIFLLSLQLVLVFIAQQRYRRSHV